MIAALLFFTGVLLVVLVREFLRERRAADPWQRSVPWQRASRTLETQHSDGELRPAPSVPSHEMERKYQEAVHR